MKISMKWLAKYVDLPESPQKLAERETVTGIEVDEIIYPAEGLKNIVVGQILTLEAHPDSDHLNICQVAIGEQQPYQIVCGAPNVAEGQKVIVALPGARIVNNQKIKKSKMRGVESRGMLCSLQEIGFNENVVPDEFKDGIYVFPENETITVGESVFPYLGMDDTILNFDATPNRADVLGMRGAAWEVASMYDQKPHFTVPDVPEETEMADSKFTNEVFDNNLAPTYRNRIVTNVKVQPSPLWLQIYLWNNGIKPINNIVDITNYVLLDYGQPLHAYDFDKLGSKKLTVRNAENGETFKALNDNEYELTDQDIVIVNDEQAVSLAGVMGGQSTSIDAQTKTVVLESAVFDSIRVRKTAQRHNLRTEAAARFEKGIDVATTQEALDQAAQLVQTLADGKVLAGQVVGSQTNLEPTIVKITIEQINHALGTNIKQEEIIAIFERLGFTVQVEADILVVTVPLRRWDISIPADLIEEVVRIYGFDKLPSTLPVSTQTVGGYTTQQQFLRNGKTFLRSLGYDEAISYALTTEEKAQAFTVEQSTLTKVDWPMTRDHEYLRLNLVSGLLDDLAYNVARKQTNVALFEQGRVFVKSQSSAVRPTEVEMLAGAITGTVQEQTWETKARLVNFYDVKGDVEQLINSFNKQGRISYQATTSITQLHPGQSALIMMDDQCIGFIGTVHPVYAQQLKLPVTIVFQLNLDKIMALTDQSQIYVPASKFPSITRDVAILVPKNVTNEAIDDTIRQAAGKYLTDIKLFDIYVGTGVPAKYKSMAYSLTFQNKQETLTDAVVNQHFTKVQTALQNILGAKIR
ncbi:phenylalanine--tRNA ligase subunit beta [Bombilactobacillus thymidiniphilus]|uniref:Phenylalanine--tRNA ligase beta subunit n=1 Tax=Bombilactobacillus thymidiniphilus TaxID=2923363 RepID=A0ABY4PCN6_9LACO|nr:phenylalanine--tRNA ligase subunit beta [Bombilactobacillus thymidiniphilus]UQS83380.1 phenylalanine--tRNA ligase subunit beta [Bombilactobacillus thymidiniphilus]